MMPIYLMYCEKCDKEYEMIVKYEERDSCKCPVCENKMESRVGKLGHIDFYGTGFYTTEYKKKWNRHGGKRD